MRVRLRKLRPTTAMAAVLLWVNALDEAHPPFHCGLAACGDHTLYSSVVRRGLCERGIVGPAATCVVVVGSRGAAWAQQLKTTRGMVVGLLLAQAKFALDPFVLVMEEQRAVRNCWFCSKWGDDSLAYFDMLEYMSFESHVWHTKALGKVRPGLFWKASPLTAERLLGEQAHPTGETVAMVVVAAAARQVDGNYATVNGTIMCSRRCGPPHAHNGITSINFAGAAHRTATMT